MFRICVILIVSLGYAELRHYFLVEQGVPQIAESNFGQVDQYPRRLHAEHLPNAIVLHPRVISGGLPEGDAAFERLKSLGIQTIISVDGAKPDIAMARRHGLQYIHLPHGYDGIPDQRLQELAKAIHSRDGPFYIHCHHGKHRSPVAAGVACVAAGLIPDKDLPTLLKLAETSPKYRGLFDTAQQARALDKDFLEQIEVEFREIAKVPPIAQAMVDIQETYAHLLEIAAAGWVAPRDHPDLHPAHEALLLKEHYRELLRSDLISHYPEDFKSLLTDAAGAAEDLENALNKRNGTTEKQLLKFDRYLGRTTASCVSCHTSFRDVPISEKRPPSSD